MKANEIKQNILDADCKEDLTIFFDRLEIAINNDECDFEEDEWQLISNVAKWKKNEFDERTYH